MIPPLPDLAQHMLDWAGPRMAGGVLGLSLFFCFEAVRPRTLRTAIKHVIGSLIMAGLFGQWAGARLPGELTEIGDKTLLGAVICGAFSGLAYEGLKWTTTRLFPRKDDT